MFIRAYLRASTEEQDADRARQSLTTFANDHGHPVACWYTENASGALRQRPQLQRLLSDAQPGDVLLIEAIDRLSRLTPEDWKHLRGEIDAKGMRLVVLDLPTSHTAMTQTAGDDFTARMLDAINAMMIDMMAAIARKDYEQRRERQQQGIAKAKQEGKYKGRPADEEKRQRIRELLAAGFSVRKVAKLAPASTSTIYAVKTEAKGEDNAKS